LLLKAVGRLFIFDKNYLKSVSLFWENLPAARQAKQDFVKLQKKNKTTLSVKDICHRMLKQINTLKVIKF